MDKKSDLLQTILFFQALENLGKELCKYMQSKGFSVEDIKLLEKYSSLYVWVNVLSDYVYGVRNIVGFSLNGFILLVLKNIMLAIPDVKLLIKMDEFIKLPTVEKAVEIIEEIQKEVPIEILKDLFNRVINMLFSASIEYKKDENNVETQVCIEEKN